MPLQKKKLRKICPMVVFGDTANGEKEIYVAYMSEPSFPQFSKFMAASKKDEVIAMRTLGHDVVLLYSADSSAYTPGQMRKQKELVERKAQCPVIFVLRTVAAYNVRRLVRHRVNFIIPPHRRR